MALRVFDKDGRPIALAPATRFLMVRRFRNPGGRGTCEVLYDDAGEVLMLEAESFSIPSLRQAVDDEPGLYRLDQCDETGNDVDGAPAAYVPIAATRNAAPMTATTEPLAIVRDLAQTNAEVSKVFADKAAGMMDALVECVRVVGGMPQKRLLANAALGLKLAPEHEDEYDDNDRDDGDAAPEPPPEPVGVSDRMAEHAGTALVAAAPVIAKALTDKLMEVLASLLTKGTPPAAAPDSTTTHHAAAHTEPAPSGSPGVDASGAAAGAGRAGPSATEPPSADAAPAASAAPVEPTSPTPASSSAASSPESTPSPAEPRSVPLARVEIPSRNVAASHAPAASPGAYDALAGVPTLTAEQLQHFLAIYHCLTLDERALVQGVLDKLNAGAYHAERVQLMSELTSRSVEEGVAFVRAFIRQAIGRDLAGKEPTS